MDDLARPVAWEVAWEHALSPQCPPPVLPFCPIPLSDSEGWESETRTQARLLPSGTHKPLWQHSPHRPCTLDGLKKHRQGQDFPPEHSRLFPFPLVASMFSSPNASF